MAEDARFIYRFFLIILIGRASTKHAQQVKIRPLPHDSILSRHLSHDVVLLLYCYALSIAIHKPFWGIYGHVTVGKKSF